MALHLEPVSGSFPSATAPANPAWDDAFLRVESYLRAHHLESRVLLNRLAAEVIAEAVPLAHGRTQDEFVTLAMQVLHARAGMWFARVFPDGDWTDDRFRARGRLALLLADVPTRWPEAFLSNGPLPEELVTAMRSCAFEPGPELRFTSMPPTPAGELFGDDADPASGPVRQGPLVRLAVYAIMVLGGLIGIISLTGP